MSRADALIAALVAGALAGTAAADGPPRTDPDWPCVQRKVPTLTPAAIWTGPAIEETGDWAAEPEVRELVARLSRRRVPLEEAEAEIAAYAGTLPPETRAERLTLLFAGLFETMNAERGDVIEGIERYARRQKELAAEVRRDAAALEAARRSAEPDPAAVAEAERKLFWDQRVFDDRRKSLPYICEVPRLVESRLFALGRAVGQVMPD